MSTINKTEGSNRIVHVFDVRPPYRQTIEGVLHACELTPQRIASVGEVARTDEGCNLVLAQDRVDEVTDQHITSFLESGCGLILFSKQPSLPRAVRLMTLGVAGYLEWPFGRPEFSEALETIDGVGSERLRLLALRASAMARLKRLSPRELQVFRLVCAGHSSEDIALELGIARRTVEGHRFNLLTKLEMGLPLAQRLSVYAGFDR